MWHIIQHLMEESVQHIIAKTSSAQVATAAITAGATGGALASVTPEIVLPWLQLIAVAFAILSGMLGSAVAALKLYELRRRMRGESVAK
ncbi:hypothetical protein A7A08_01725 [Methyloligella halotolerans]|uniref:Holin n=1 Tax=Methyloligella halotolerans TaxID=1177755 RepID=A0A1E2RZV2_9HYPH|nr:hypothetical protein [Methyloligella halotolerans]ODA67690.1 hypothetical protein A7A08_01725 [Methyloligella halotolerans]